MAWLKISVIVCLSVYCVNSQIDETQYGSASVTGRCYSDSGRPQRCTPPFVNAAFNVPVVSTNTCGTRQPTYYCTQVRNKNSV